MLTLDNMDSSEHGCVMCAYFNMSWIQILFICSFAVVGRLISMGVVLIHLLLLAD